ncbi:hypothetical protein, partial [Streptomyces scabiei]
ALRCPALLREPRSLAHHLSTAEPATAQDRTDTPMPADPYTVLRALLRAEALRSTPEPTPRPLERTGERRGERTGEHSAADRQTPVTDKHPSHRRPAG